MRVYCIHRVSLHKWLDNLRAVLSLVYKYLSIDCRLRRGASTVNRCWQGLDNSLQSPQDACLENISSNPPKIFSNCPKKYFNAVSRCWQGPVIPRCVCWNNHTDKWKFYSFYRTLVRSLATLVTHWLTPWRLVDLIDVTLACEDANSKFVEVVTVANVNDEDGVDKSLLRFLSWGLVIKQIFCSDFGHKVWSNLWSWISAKIYKLKFGQYFAADVFLEVWSWILVNILICKFSRGADVRLRFWSWYLVEILKTKFDQDLCLSLFELW